MKRISRKEIIVKPETKDAPLKITVSANQPRSPTLRPTFPPSFDQRCDKQSGRVQVEAIPRGYELA